MKILLNIIKREVNEIKKSKFIQIILFIAPLFFSFCGWLTYSSGTLTNLPIAVYDKDNSNITREITRAINSMQSVSVKYKVSNYYDGFNLIKSGKAYAFIVYPQNFKKDLFEKKRPKIVYYYNNQAILTGGIITKDIQNAVIASAKSIDAKIRMKNGLAKNYVLNTIKPIKIDEHIKSNPYLNYSYFLFYAITAHIFQVFATLLSIWSIGTEFKYGTTKEWIKLSENSVIKAVFGKLFIYLSVLSLEMIIVYVCYVLLYGGIFEGSIIFTVFSSIVFIFAYQMMGMAFVAILSNLRFAMSAGAFYTSLGFSFSGITFPDMSMPIFARIYAFILPVKHYVNLIIDQALKGVDIKVDFANLFFIFFYRNIRFLFDFSFKKELI